MITFHWGHRLLTQADGDYAKVVRVVTDEELGREKVEASLEKHPREVGQEGLMR